MTRNIARSSNGRTPGFGPVCGGSSPPRATNSIEWIRLHFIVLCNPESFSASNFWKVLSQYSPVPQIQPLHEQ